MKIKTRLRINTIISVCIAFAIGTVISLAAYKINQETKHERTINEAIKEISELEILTYEYLLHHVETVGIQWQSKQQSITQLLISIGPDSSPKEKAILINIKDDLKNIKMNFNQLILASQKSMELDQEHAALSREYEERLGGQLMTRLNGLIFDFFRLSKIYQTEINITEIRTIWSIILFVIIMVLVVWISSFIVSKSILHPIAKLEEGTKTVGSGNMDIRIDIKSKDEFGQLAVSFNKMSESLKESQNEIKTKSSFLQLHSLAAVSANEAKEIEDAFRPILKGVCSYTGWPIGHVYIISKNDPNLLGPTTIWNIKDYGRFSKFCEITKVTKFKKGRGLPGRVMANGQPHWIKDVTKDIDFLRSPIAKEVGIKAAFAFPVMVESEVVAVLEFFSTEVITTDSRLLEVVSDVGTQLGRVFERKRAEEEHIKTQKLESVGILAGGIAHDFNNFLQGILSNIILAKRNTVPNTEAYASLTESEKGVVQAKQLSKQLLTFSKGGGPIKKVISVLELIKDSASFALSGSNIRCEYELPEGPCLVEIDKGQMNQVFNNLFINADQAMPEGGVIKVKVEYYNVEEKGLLTLKEGRYVKITIKDQGTGVSQKHLQKIFDPYFTTKEMGSGLGLATCFSIIKKHDGHITVESELGTGTTFHIYLPASKEEMSRKPVPGGPEASCPELVEGEHVRKDPILDGKKILLMDDDLLISMSVSQQLRDLKYEVETAKNGTKTIEMYKGAMISNRSFDAVILDLTIPGGMGGVETIKELIGIDTDVNAIVASGYSNDHTMTNFREYGFKGVVEKPYEIYELDDALRKVILEKNE